MAQKDAHTTEKMEQAVPLSESTIQLDERNTRSLPTAILFALLKIIKPKVAKLPDLKNSYEGSMQIKPHSSIRHKVEVKETTVSRVFVYEVSPKLPPGIKYATRHDLYFFCGGAFVASPSRHHWKLCAELAARLPEYRVHVVSYPLAPRNRAAQSLAILRPFISEIFRKAESGKRTITLAGDSSGGNVATSLALYVADEAIKNGSSATPLRNLLLISPSLDLRIQNPEIDAVDPLDPVLSKKFVLEVSKNWAGDEVALDDPTISPIFADLTSLRTLGIKVHGVIGKHDVCAPDAIAFRRRLQECDVTGRWLEWDRQLHCFPLTFYFHLPEGVQGKDWILDALRDNA